MAATLPNTVLFYMKTIKLSVKRGGLLRLHFEHGLTRYSCQTLPLHSLTILWSPEMHSQTKHIGKRPKRWGKLAHNRLLERYRVLSLNLLPWAHFAAMGCYQALVSYTYNSYSMLIDFDDRKLQLIFLQHINTNHVLVSVNRFNFNFLLSISLH